jgi:hypothetical protein
MLYTIIREEHEWRTVVGQFGLSRGEKLTFRTDSLVLVDTCARTGLSTFPIVPSNRRILRSLAAAITVEIRLTWENSSIVAYEQAGHWSRSRHLSLRAVTVASPWPKPRGIAPFHGRGGGHGGKSSKIDVVKS